VTGSTPTGHEGPPSLRLLLVSRAVPAHQLGGLERHARDVARGLADRGHSVEVWTTAHPAGIETASDGGAVVRFFPGTAPAVHSPRFREEVLKELQGKREQFDVLLSESTSASYAIERLEPPARPPAVAMMHGTAVSEALSIIAADRGKGKWLRTLFRVLPARRALAKEEVRMLRRTERVLCVSEYVGRLITDRYRIDAQRVRVVRNGVPLPPLPDEAQRLRARASLGLGAGEPVLLCVGRLARNKGFGLAIRAFGACRGAGRGTLVIVGGGPDEERLRVLAARLKQRVLFAGPVAPTDVPAYLHAADVLLLPSIRYEGHPYVLIEGAAAGLAVIAANRGGLGSELAGRDIGLLVRPGSVRQLAKAMTKLLSDADLRARLGRNLRAHAERHYAIGAMLDGIERVIREALEARVTSPV
jgi:phosphatidylinositol alpha-1,6-mannosyltransferase